MKEMFSDYESPVLEAVEIEVEKGFAISRDAKGVEAASFTIDDTAAGAFGGKSDIWK